MSPLHGFEPRSRREREADDFLSTRVRFRVDVATYSRPLLLQATDQRDTSWLQKDGCLTVHDEAFNGRNRRYYQITPAGRAQLAGYRAEWDAYTAKIDRLFEGETQ